MEEMHEVAESELVELTRPTMLFSCINELELPDIDDAETDPEENLQNNGATPQVFTQPSPLHSPLEDALVSPAAPLQYPHVKAGNVALQA